LVTLVIVDPEVLQINKEKIVTFLDKIPAGKDKILDTNVDLLQSLLSNF
jgi:hypothetical protein